MRSRVMPFLASFLLTFCSTSLPIGTEVVSVITPTPSRTPRPVFTPFLTSTPFLTPETTVYELPDWLRDSKDHVLMGAVLGENRSAWTGMHDHIFLADADNKEQYRIDLAYFSDAYWLDDLHIIFIHGDSCTSFKYYSVLNLSTGRLSRRKAEDFAGDACSPAIPKFRMGVSIMEENPPVRVYDVRQGNFEDFMPQVDGIVNVSAKLSPNNKLVVVLQNTNSSQQSERFAVYDFSSRELSGVYEVSNVNPLFHFTSDSKNIIFLDDNLPCVLDLQKLERKCGVPIPESYRGYQQVHFSGLTQDSASILFILDVVADDQVYGGGLCIYEIYSGKVNCPMDQLNILRLDQSTDALFVFDYELSRDEQYIAFIYAGGCPTCDYISSMNIGIVNFKGDYFFDLREASYVSYFEWRPMP